jgi:hypothetical protein
MRLATLAEYRRLVYIEGSAPTLSTLRNRIKDIPGGRVELGRYYVDLDVNQQAQRIASAAQNRLDEIMNDPLIKAMNRERPASRPSGRRRAFFGL